IVWRFSRALFIPPCIALTTGAGSLANGTSRKTIEQQSITVSQRQACVDCKRKSKSGTPLRMSSRESRVPHLRKYDSVEPPSILGADHAAALADGKRDGCGTAISNRGVCGGIGECPLVLAR